MVEVDVQILAGVAVTIFLALLFFATIVLWDVALALRGVADKVDKLEDTLDDNLTEIHHAIDGTGGPGGGTQLHLSGGGTTISSGPTPAQTAPGPHPHASTQSNDSRTDPQSTTESGTNPQSTTAAHSTQETPETSTDAAETVADESPSSDSAESDETEPSRSRASMGADPTPVRGPDAARRHDSTDPNPNRGRFVTSPDRTPWYATPLDGDAISEATSVIAGELEAGDVVDESTDDGEPTTEPSREPIVLGGQTSDDGPTDESNQPGESTSDNVDASEKPADDAVTDGDDDATATRGTLNDDIDDESASLFDDLTREDLSTVADSVDEPPEADELTAAELFEALLEDLGLADLRTRVDELADGELGGDAGPVDTEVASNDGDASSEVPHDGDHSGSELTDEDSSDGSETEITDEIGDGPDTESAAHTGDGSDAVETNEETGDQTDAVESNEDDGVEQPSEAGALAVSDEDAIESDETIEDSLEPDEAEIEDDSMDDASLEDGVAFTFEEFSAEEPPAPEVSIDDAVRSINDEEPTLERSTHDVSARATADDDGVVLTYELEGKETTDSTNRLLRYQLQSFADQSDASVDVSVSGTRVVVEIEGADAADVSQWQRAVVEVIDRTYYLSDTSE
ncbi:AAA family ATPase [Halovivax gelatinilyticus]|uniref:AAA family ATPase n=1 Tax=Halovivax gelatinilyticus TaxID=2961597 RepID=UPI0020CA80CB|nr:AAA family ATPase [Halovivax gelatinilyticus]